MKEICLLGKGDNIDKLSYKLGIDRTLQISSDTIHNYKYVIIKDGNNNVQIIRNYNPYFISNNITINKLESNGYEVINNCGDDVVFYKPTGIKYGVKPLESLESIANKFGVSVESIVVSNNLNTTKLFVGQVLII